MRRTTFLLAAFGLLAAVSPAWADEGLWPFTNPPRKQLKEKYAFELTDALLERLQKASVMVGSGGSGAFVSPDGLVLTNHHVAFQWLHELSEKREVSLPGSSGAFGIAFNWLQRLAGNGPDLLRYGFVADQRDKELPCPGLDLRVLWCMTDVSDRVQDAIKPDMTTSQASRARETVLRAIEEESRQETGLDSEAVPLYHGARYHLHRFKKYTDVRLVFAPEQGMAPLLDVCLLRAYEGGKPAKIAHYLAWSASAPMPGDLVLVSGYPGASDRFRTSADLEDVCGQQSYLYLKAVNRMNNVLTQFAKASPDNERRARLEISRAQSGFGYAWGTLSTQEGLLARIRTREDDQQVQWARKDPAAADRRRQALDRIAGCLRDGAELSRSYFFLDSSYAFQSSLFRYARVIVRLADRQDEPEVDGDFRYGRGSCEDLERYLLMPKTIVKEIEILKLADSLDLFMRHAGKDADLAAQVMDGKTPKERARALIEGTRLDRVEVRKTLLEGGPEAVAQSRDPMLILARLVEPRTRKVHQDMEEKIWEPCRQAYADLMRIEGQTLAGSSYPDANHTLRLSYGVVQADETAASYMLGSHSSILNLADIFQYAKEHPKDVTLPANWLAAQNRFEKYAPILFTNSADLVPGNSGSPVVDRQGRVIGVAFRGRCTAQLAYLENEAATGAVAAHGMLELLDKVYLAANLVQELRGKGEDDPAKVVAKNGKTEAAPLTVLPPPPPLPPSVVSGSVPLPPPPSSAVVLASAELPTTAGPKQSFSAQSQYRPLRAIMGIAPPTVPPSHVETAPPSSPSIEPVHFPSTNSLPRSNAAIVPAPEPSPVVAVTKVTGQADLNKELALDKELALALVKAYGDNDNQVSRDAETALGHLGRHALPGLLDALQSKDKKLRRGAALFLGRLGNAAQTAVPALGSVLEDEDVEVRRMAAWALASILSARAK